MLGRFLWNQFADQIHAVLVPVVPVLIVTTIAIGAVLLANIVAIDRARAPRRAYADCSAATDGVKLRHSRRTMQRSPRAAG